jgi:hypothetical protein
MRMVSPAPTRTQGRHRPPPLDGMRATLAVERTATGGMVR